MFSGYPLEELPSKSPSSLLPSLSEDFYLDNESNHPTGSLRQNPNEYYGNSRWMDQFCRMPLTFRERIVLIPLIIIALVLTVFIFLRTAKQPVKYISPCSKTTTCKF